MQPTNARPIRAKLDAWELAALEKLVQMELDTPRTSIDRDGLRSALDKLGKATGPMPSVFRY